MLELGAGTGKLTEVLVALGHDVHATDPDEAMLARLRERLPDVRTSVASAEEIPAPDASFDVVVVAQAFHWFDHDRALPEIARVLKPGGRLALVWNQRDERIPWVRRLGAIIGTQDQQYSEQPLVTSPLFGFVEDETFKHWQVVDRDSIQDLVLSRSNVAVLDEEARAAKLAEVLAFYDDYGRGMDGMQLPYRASCFRAAVADRPATDDAADDSADGAFDGAFDGRSAPVDGRRRRSGRAAHRLPLASGAWPPRAAPPSRLSPCSRPCSPRCSPAAGETDETDVLPAAHGWSYADVDTWGGTCATGDQQSPVDLGDATGEQLPDLDLAYTGSGATVTDTGHSVQVTLEDAGTMVLGEETYTLRQFHVHTPSEHEVDGEAYAAELHLVHEDDAGDLAVLAVLVEEGAAHPVIDDVLDHVPEEGADPLPTTEPIEPESLLPDERRTYRYDGSLTMPPCTEGVAWTVLEEPVTWTAEQIAGFAERHPGSHRPLQPLDGRALLHDTR